MSSFAQDELLKYGWEKGAGLGLQNDGIVKPISIGMKNDNKGVGAEDNYEFQWWDHVFNKASCAIKIEKDDDGKVTVCSKVDSTTKSSADRKLLYGNFVKASSNASAGAVEKTDYSIKICDAELLKACEGRTARKGARVDQHAKISRADAGSCLANELEDQSQQKNKKSRLIPTIDIVSKKRHKKRKHSEDTNESKHDDSVIDVAQTNPLTNNEDILRKLKKQKSKRAHHDTIIDNVESGSASQLALKHCKSSDPKDGDGSQHIKKSKKHSKSKRQTQE